MSTYSSDSAGSEFRLEVPALSEIFSDVKAQVVTAVKERGIPWRFLSRKLGSSLGEALNLPLEGVLGNGWGTLEALQQYLAEPPEELFDHSLGTHTIRSVHEPSVEIVRKDWMAGRVDFTIELTFKISAVRLAIQAGEILSARPGACNAVLDVQCRLDLSGFAQTIVLPASRASFALPAFEFETPVPISRFGMTDGGTPT